MAQFPELDAVRLPERPLHLAIGMFDGLHLGHHTVIDSAVQSAKEDEGISAVLTFWPHPSTLFRPEEPTRLIMSPQAKARVLARMGVEVVITQGFTREFAQIPAELFLTELKRYLPHLVSVYVGENWRYGRGRVGDVALLVKEAKSLGLSVVSVPRVNFDGEPISSTRIRRLLEEGAIERANALLGYAYFSEGTIVAGKGLGRTIGFPTLNLDWTSELAPRFGVYAVRVSREGGPASLPGVANYGLRPTVENTTNPRLEVHLLGDCPIGPGDEVKVEWKRWIRPEMKFSGVEALTAQIAQDRTTAAALWAHR